MSTLPARALLLFLDGVGIGEADPAVNPVARARLPRLRDLLGGTLPLRGQEQPAGSAAGRLVAADATLGVPGRPQSGTGQTALLTGINAPALLGRHFGPWVHTGLREPLARHNLLSRAAVHGRRVAFANAYPAGFLERGGGRRPAAPPLAAHAAGALTRHAPELRQGRAVASSITNDAWRAHLDPDAPLVTPAAAGRTLARICDEAELTLFAHYDTDLVGHTRDPEAAVVALERVDAFLGGVLDALSDDALLVIASDHGNIEDVRAGHTLNPVPVIATGPGSAALTAQVSDITQVAPAILQLLEIP